jgi:hypothetical protein
MESVKLFDSESNIEVIKEDMKNTLENLVEYLFDDVSKKEIELSEGVIIKLDNLIDEKKFEEKLFDLLNIEKVNKIRI